MAGPTIFIAPTGDRQLNNTLETIVTTLANVSSTVVSTNANSVTETNGAIISNGSVVGYRRQYIWVTFSTDGFGSGASPSPLNKTFYGIINDNSGTVQPTAYLNYSYTAVAGGFGSTSQLFYKTPGGRQIFWHIGPTAPSADWRVVPNGPSSYVAIDLDVLTVASSTPGANGYSAYDAIIYKADTAQPLTPVGGSYTFSTGALIAPSGWANTIPTITTENVYAATQTFTTTNAAVPVSGGAWALPRGVFRQGSDGANGTAGLNATSTYNLSAYTRFPTLPGTPTTGTGTWSFGSGTGTPPSGAQTWSLAPPGGTDQLWISYGVVAVVGSGTGSAGVWSTPVPLAQTGSAGINGLSIYNYPVWQSNVGTPNTPVGGQYDFGTRTGTPPPGWFNSAAGLTGNIWIATGVAKVEGNTGVDTIIDWDPPSRWNGADGINGSNGSNGRTTVVRAVYAAKISQPDNITTLGYYNFATNVLTPPTAGDVTWYSEIPPASGGFPIWTSQATFTTVDISLTLPNATPWTQPALTFSPGAPGADGTRGFIPLAFVVVGVDPYTLTSAQLTAAFSAPRTGTNPPIGLGYPPIAGDTAQFYYNNRAVNQQDITLVSQYDGTNWIEAPYRSLVSGNLIVTGSVTSSQINTNEVYSLKMRSTNATIDDNNSPGYWANSFSGSARFGGSLSIGNNLTVGDNAVIGNNLTVAGLITTGALNFSTVDTNNILNNAVTLCGEVETTGGIYDFDIGNLTPGSKINFIVATVPKLTTGLSPGFGANVSSQLTCLNNGAVIADSYALCVTSTQDNQSAYYIPSVTMIGVMDTYLTTHRFRFRPNYDDQFAPNNGYAKLLYIHTRR